MKNNHFLLETLKLRFVGKPISAERRSICETCPIKDGEFCSSSTKGTAVKNLEYDGEQRILGNQYPGCGCIIKWKTSLINEKCPLGKWDKAQ
jgi:hypothetical protein